MDDQTIIDNVKEKLKAVGITGAETGVQSVDELVEAIRLMAKNEAINMVDEFFENLAKSGKQGQVLTRGEGLVMEWKDPAPCSCGGECGKN